MQRKAKLAIAFVVVFSFGAIAGYTISGAGHRCRAQANDKGKPAAVSLCPTMDQAEELFNSDNGKDRVLGMILGQAWAKTDRGHERLRSMLASSDTHAVRFAAHSIDSACDLSDVPLLLEAARRHRQDNTVVQKCMSAVGFVLGKLSAGTPVDSSTTLEKASQWLDSNENQWRNKPYVEYWGEELSLALKTMREQSAHWESQEYFGQTLFTLLESRDAKRCVPEIMKVLGEANPKTDPIAIGPLLHALEVYIGPMDIPVEEADALAEKRQGILAWWKDHSAKNPGQWVVSVLAQRGVTLDMAKPASVLDWVDKALREGSTADQYAAALVLAYAFPGGRDIPFLNGDFLLTTRDRYPPAVSNCLAQYRIAQTAYCSMISEALTWNEKKGTYSIGLASTQAFQAFR